MLTALLFDLDGTIADTDPIHYQTWQDVLRPFDLALPQGLRRNIDPPFYKARFSGRRNEEIIPDLLPWMTLEEGERLSQRKEALFRRAAAALQPLPGLLNLLDWTDQQNLKRAVVTNAPRANAEFMLQILGLQDRFPRVILGEELEIGKPDPLPYLVALSELEVPAGLTIAFEDSPSGIRSAVGASILTVGIATSQTPEDLYQLGATLVIPDFTDDRLYTLLRSAMGIESNP